MDNNAPNLPMPGIEAFCRRWKIVDLALFGSALREDFSANSDIDLLVTFAADAGWSLFDHAQMELELIDLLGREVDLLTRRAVENSNNTVRKSAIPDSARSIFHAA